MSRYYLYITSGHPQDISVYYLLTSHTYVDLHCRAIAKK